MKKREEVQAAKMNRIELYTYLYYICLVLCIFCLAAAAVLFFYYDIRSVIGYLTGRSARKEIRELEEGTAVSERLMYKKSGSGKQDKKKKSKKAYVMESVRGCAVSVGEYKERDESCQETTALEQKGQDFVIQREILFIHTDEMI